MMNKFCFLSLIYTFGNILQVLQALTVDDLQMFFKETYIRKETGIFSPISKNYQEGYDSGWDLYRLHHVCIPKGGEGIFVGLKDVDNKWKTPDRPFSNQYVAEEDWNVMKKLTQDIFKRNQVLSYRTQRFDLKEKPPKKVTLLEGGSYFFNCDYPSLFEQYSDSDFISRLSVLYELALFHLKNSGEEIWKISWPVPFKNILTNRCKALWKVHRLKRSSK